MKVYLFILITFFNYSCANSNHHISPKYVVLAEGILKEMEEKLSKQYHMRVISDTTGLMDNVNLLGLGFQIQGPLTREQLRVILVGCVEAFLSALNSNDEIRPYLKTYPFTAEGIDIGIFVLDSNGRGVADPYIGIAQSFHGTLDYITIDRKGHQQNKFIISETYDDALQIVRSYLKA